MLINVSRYKLAQECATKWYWTYERNIVPKQKSIPLVRGSSVHSGLATWFTTGDADEALKVFEQEYREFAEKGRFITEELNAVDEHVDAGKYLLREYFRQFPVEPWEFPRAEQQFKSYVGERCFYCGHPFDDYAKPSTLPNPELNNFKCAKCHKPVHVLIGRADLIVTFRNSIWVVDHKTHKQLSQTMLANYRRERQGTGYVYGLSKAMGYKINGFIINVLKTTKVPDFVRDIFIISDRQLRWFVRDLYLMVEDIERWRERRMWMQNPGSCYLWFKACPFLSLCDMYKDPDEIVDEEIFPLGFEQREVDYADETFVKEDRRI